jgi:WD40 repeat protein
VLALVGACRPDQGKPARIVARVHAAGQFVSSVALDASGSALLGLADRDELRVWSFPTTGADSVFSLRSKGPLILADFIAPERVMAVTATGNFSEWDWTTRARTLSHKLDAGGAAAYSRDGRYLALGGALWDRKEERDLATLPVGEQIALGFSDDGSRLLSAGRHPSQLIVREPRSGRVFRQESSEDIRAAVLNARGDRVAAALLSGIVRIFRVPDFQIVSEFWTSPDPVALLFLDDEHVVTAGETCVEVHAVATSWKTFHGAVSGQVTAFASSAEQAVAGTSEGKIWIWDLAKGETLASAQLASSAIRAVALSAKARRAAAGDETGVVTVVGW